MTNTASFDKNIHTVPCNTPCKTEFVIIAVILSVFLILGLTSASRMIAVWQDETAYTDPAVNLFLNGTFSTSAWCCQSDDEFWAGNVPVHSLLLYLWIWCSGINISSVRFLNYLYTCAALFMIWISIVRLNLLTTRWTRILMVILVLSGQGITFCYTSGRPDCLTILVASATLLIWTINKTYLRLLLLCLFGFLTVFCGPQLIVYAVSLFILLSVFTGMMFFQEYLATITGYVTGAVSLYAFYKHEGVWNIFLKCLSSQSILPVLGILDSGYCTRLMKIILIKSQNLFTIEYWNDGLLKEHSYHFLYMFLVILFCYQIYKKRVTFRSPVTFGLAAGLLIPITMYFSSKYPLYYSWMAYIPVTICVCSAMSILHEITGSGFFNKTWVFLFWCFALAAALYGLPRSLFNTCTSWSSMDYAIVERYIGLNVGETDIVYSDYQAFYAVKKTAAKTYFPCSLDWITPEKKQTVSVAILDPERKEGPHFHPGYEQVLAALGGHWLPAGEDLVTGEYRLRILRRKSTP